MSTNWFIVSCGVLQLAGAFWFLYTGSPKLGALYILYAATNFILGTMR